MKDKKSWMKKNYSQGRPVRRFPEIKSQLAKSYDPNFLHAFQKLKELRSNFYVGKIHSAFFVFHLCEIFQAFKNEKTAIHLLRWKNRFYFFFQTLLQNFVISFRPCWWMKVAHQILKCSCFVNKNAALDNEFRFISSISFLKKASFVKLCWWKEVFRYWREKFGRLQSQEIVFKRKLRLFPNLR